MADIGDVEKVAPVQCGSCGHWFYASIEPGNVKCPRCGARVECV